jgi:hypothetical protein
MLAIGVKVIDLTEIILFRPFWLAKAGRVSARGSAKGRASSFLQFGQFKNIGFAPSRHVCVAERAAF